MGYFAVAYGIAIGAAFLPLEPVWLKWIVAVVLLGIYAWYVKGHFEADASVDLEDLAPLRFHRLDRDRPPRGPGRAAAARRQCAGRRGPGPDHPGCGLLRRCRRAPGQHPSASTNCCSRSSSRRSRRSSPRSSTPSCGSARARTRWRWATSPARWSSSRRSRRSSRCVFASNSWVVGPGSYVAFASAGIAFLSSAFIFLPMARSGPSARSRAAGRRRVLPRVSGARRSRRDRRHRRLGREPTDILGLLVEGALTRMITQKSAETPASTGHHARRRRRRSTTSSATSRASSSRCATRRSA